MPTAIPAYTPELAQKLPAAAGLAAASTIIPACTPLIYLDNAVVNQQIKILKSKFWKVKGDKRKPIPLVLIQNNSLSYPISVFKKSETEYHACELVCTHRGCELQTGGEQFTCPCHSSEFSQEGKVLTGPATTDLKKYKTDIHEDHIIINLA